MSDATSVLLFGPIFFIPGLLFFLELTKTFVGLFLNSWGCFVIKQKPITALSKTFTVNDQPFQCYHRVRHRGRWNVLTTYNAVIFFLPLNEFVFMLWNSKRFSYVANITKIETENFFGKYCTQSVRTTNGCSTARVEEPITHQEYFNVLSIHQSIWYTISLLI